MNKSVCQGGVDIEHSYKNKCEFLTKSILK